MLDICLENIAILLFFLDNLNSHCPMKIPIKLEDCFSKAGW